MLGKNIFFRILSIIFRCRPFSTPGAVFSGNGERESGGTVVGEWGNGELGAKLMNDRIKHFTNASNAFLESF